MVVRSRRFRVTNQSQEEFLNSSSMQRSIICSTPRETHCDGEASLCLEALVDERIEESR